MENKFREEMERRKTAYSKTDWDKWGDRAIVALVMLIPAWIIIRAIMG